MNKARIARELGIHPSTLAWWLEGRHSPKGAYRKLLEEKRPDLLERADKAFKNRVEK